MAECPMRYTTVQRSVCSNCGTKIACRESRGLRYDAYYEDEAETGAAAVAKAPRSRIREAPPHGDKRRNQWRLRIIGFSGGKTPTKCVEPPLIKHTVRRGNTAAISNLQAAGQARLNSPTRCAALGGGGMSRLRPRIESGARHAPYRKG